MRNIVLFLLVLSCLPTFSQSKKVESATKKYANLEYFEAINEYEQVIKNGASSAQVYLNLANAYYFNSEFEKAEKWYSELFRTQKKNAPESYYRYAQCLKSVNKFLLANSIMEEFCKKAPKDLRGLLFKNQLDFQSKILANSGRFIIQNCDFNSSFSDYGTTVYNETIFFSSARDSGRFAKRKHQWSNQFFTNIYQSKRISDSTYTLAQPLKKEINSQFHESTPVFTKNGTTVYFTRNNFLNGRKGKDRNQTTLLKIYRAQLIDNQWNNVTELPFNSDSYNVAHPALSTDEKTLYFASDMPGTIGNSDLFYVEINDDGTYGKPINLGPKINTEGKENFPFLSSQNELYFASDGHPGLGGLDIFVSKNRSKNTFGSPINIGEPVNSGYDDFGYYFDFISKTGFFSSNRKNGKGLDDIYQLTETIPLPCEMIYTGTVLDLNDKPLSDLKITVFDAENNIVKNSKTTENGRFELSLNCQIPYQIKYEKEGFQNILESIKSSSDEHLNGSKIKLTPINSLYKVGNDLAKTLNIKKILFDLDQSNIREDAANELMKILKVMHEQPTMQINIRSHTDSRETNTYNLKLSNRRAKSTLEWLVKNGIDRDRLTATGFGESQLNNDCTDLIPCTEEQHQENRRSEFIILAL